MREMGIALATAFSAWLNALLLYVILKVRDNITLDSRLISNSVKTIICSIVMGVACYFSNLILFSDMILHSLILNLSGLFLVIVVSKIVYYVMIFMLRVLTIDELKGYIKK